MKKRNRCDLLRGEHGASLIEMTLLLPMFAVLLFVAVDFGRACYAAIEIAGAARAGAVYGSRNPTDTTGMANIAVDDAPDVSNVSAGTPTYDCECADGTGVISASECSATPPTPPSCTGSLNWVYKVNVTVTGTYKPLFRWPWIPSTGIPLSSSASMRSPGS
jgi:Flp pilus assembly protein TadG